MQDDADDDEKLRGDVKRVLAGEGDRAAGSASKNDEPGGDEAGADIDIGAALRTEASSAGVKVSASLIQNASAMVTSPSAP